MVKRKGFNDPLIDTEFIVKNAFVVVWVGDPSEIASITKQVKKDSAWLIKHGRVRTKRK